MFIYDFLKQSFYFFIEMHLKIIVLLCYSMCNNVYNVYLFLFFFSLYFFVEWYLKNVKKDCVNLFKNYELLDLFYLYVCMYPKNVKTPEPIGPNMQTLGRFMAGQNWKIVPKNVDFYDSWKICENLCLLEYKKQMVTAKPTV